MNTGKVLLDHNRLDLLSYKGTAHVTVLELISKNLHGLHGLYRTYQVNN